MDAFHLPLPFLTALLMAVMAARLTRTEGLDPVARRLFQFLGAVFVTRALLVGVRFGYGIDALIPLQRVLPFAVGPLAYLGFRRLTDTTKPWVGQGIRHGGLAAALMVLCPLIRPLGPLLDFLILLSMVGYTLGLAQLYRRGPDGWPSIGLADADGIRWLLHITLVFFASEGLIDGIVAIDFFLMGGRHAPIVIAIGNLGLIGALGWGLAYHRAAPAPRPAIPIDTSEADRSALLAALDGLLADPAIYGDPDLTLARLAKRLRVPARRVSEAVNQHHAMNVSQYVNRIRLLAAEPRLRNGTEPIGVVMESCGFRSKSNFNRECHRVLGGAPSAIRAGNLS